MKYTGYVYVVISLSWLPFGAASAIIGRR